MFHPSQLEKRFGGACDTPTNFWPPHVGKSFVPDGEQPPLQFMEEEEYKQTLQQNPELPWHPDFMTSPDCPNRDFTFQEQYIEIDARHNHESASSAQSFYSVNTHEMKNSMARSKGFMSSMRAGSVYLDAYVGDEDLDAQTKMQNQNTLKVPAGAASGPLKKATPNSKSLL